MIEEPEIDRADMVELGMREQPDFDRMLEYHAIDEDDWDRMSNNEKSQLCWNYRKFGGEMG